LRPLVVLPVFALFIEQTARAILHKARTWLTFEMLAVFITLIVNASLAVV